MKKSVLYFLLVIMTASAHGQNILSNPSFKDTLGCPATAGEIDSCKFWYSATIGTPDYYNACAGPFASTGIPSNMVGYQASPSGSYVGIFCYQAPYLNVREYIGTNFPALTVGRKYAVTIRVSLADKAKYATEGLGVYFYKDGNLETPALYSVLTVVPQIDYTWHGPIGEKLNWVQLTDTFVADSAYAHLVIGNYKNDTNINITEVPSANSTNALSYYYIDSASVAEVKEAPTGVSLFSMNEYVNLAPNPFTTQATMSFLNTGNEACSIVLTDINGRIVRRYNAVTTSSIIIERGELPPGVYFYKVVLPDGAYYGKVVIE